METQIDYKSTAESLVDLLGHGLCSGLGKPEPGKMCVEAAVCYAMGMDHGDDPKCVGRAVRRFKIRLNDSKWSSNEARGNGMLKLAIAQLGSNEIDQIEFAKKLSLRTCNEFLPFFLADKMPDFDTSGLVSVGDLKTARSEARSAYAAADADAAAYAAAYAADAAYAAAYAADAAADAAAAYAADAAADAAAYAAAYAAADDDKYLVKMAEIGLSVLVEMKSPGCEFLYLTEQTK